MTPATSSAPASGLSDPATFLGASAIQDPYPVYDRLREQGPVHRIGDSGFYAVCSWDAVNDAISRPEDFSSNLTATMVYDGAGVLTAFEMDPVGGPTHVLATADDPTHVVHRKMLIPRLAAKRIRASEPFIADTFHRLFDRNRREGRIEWMGGLADRLPMMVVTHLIGAPDADVDRLLNWAYASTQLLDGLVSTEQLAVSGAAAMRLSEYVLDHLRLAAADPPDNLLGDLAAACARQHLDQLTAALILVTLFGAGGESTAALLGSAASILAANPQIQRSVREDPELLAVFLEETLRFEPPFRGHYRHVLRDTELAGAALPAGSRILLLWGAANRDPDRFEAPGEFRLDRADPKAHITFGRGAHFCVGAALARLEALTVLRLLLARTSWIDAVDIGPWLPSVLVRRRQHLVLSVR